MYIRATGNISPQKTFGQPPFLAEQMEYFGNRLSCVEPDYKAIIDPKLIRRMSRIIRMGVAAAKECLHQAVVPVPDAIITGTAYGCLEDTGSFITKMVEYNEELLTPTAFIQSTHNTIGAQIGLMLQCHNYNNAFVHRGFSFESALLDGTLLLKENEVSNVLVGAIDEITDISHKILNRMGLYKQESISNLDIFKSHSKGTVAGEGAAFFLLANDPSGNDLARLEGLATFYKPANNTEIKTKILSFLIAHSTAINEIDLVINGKNGDERSDKIYDEIGQQIFNDADTVPYKHLCGEYPTATAFALWAAANILKMQTIPAAMGQIGTKEKKIKKILIYNHYQGTHHSLFLLSAC